MKSGALVVFLIALGASPALGDGRAVAFMHVAVIDTEKGTAQPDAVVVEGNRIAAVGPSGEVRIPAGARVVDGTGKFLSPGLWDMHVHTFFGDWVPGGREVTLPLFLAFGVTGVRDMGSDLDPVLAARRDVENGSQIGPRMIVSGPMLDGPKSPFPATRTSRSPRRAARRTSRSPDTFPTRSARARRRTPARRASST